MKRCLLIICIALLACIARASSVPEVNMKEVAYAPRPNYPAEARRRNLQGCGRLILHVRADGNIARVDVEGSTGASLLDQTAMAAYSKWRFKPGRARVVGATFCFTTRPYPYMPQYHPPGSP
jgi:TonB family protein